VLRGVGDGQAAARGDGLDGPLPLGQPLQDQKAVLMAERARDRGDGGEEREGWGG
jgi:hypothetical protein